MFRNIRIDGTLIVSSGTTLRATGDITIGTSGAIVVSSEHQIQTTNPSQKGIAMSASQGSLGGMGLELGRTALLTRFDLLGAAAAIARRRTPTSSEAMAARSSSSPPRATSSSRATSTPTAAKASTTACPTQR